MTFAFKITVEMRVLIAVLLGFLISISTGAEFQQWEDKSGRRMSATIVRVDGDIIIFRKADGREFEFPVLQLSLASQTEVKNWAGEQDLADVHVLFRNRIGKDRKLRAIQTAGGEQAHILAIEKGLEFLAKRQDEAGYFDSEHRVSSTGLALLAFLGYGETPESAKFGTQISRAAEFLIEAGDSKVPFRVPDSSLGSYDFELAIGSLALLEYYILSKGKEWESKKVRNVLRKSLASIRDGIGKGGGWPMLYSVKKDEKLSNTIWHLQALWLAQQTDLEIVGVDKCVEAASGFLKEKQDDKGAFACEAYMTSFRTGLTGAGTFCLKLVGCGDDDSFSKGIEAVTGLVANGVCKDSKVAGMFASLALFHDHNIDWKDAHATIVGDLVKSQTGVGNWTLEEISGVDDPIVFGTAIAILTIETPIRYAKFK